MAILDQLIERQGRWWSANRVEPWGVQTDPVAADELPFDEGSFLVLLGIRSMIAGGDDRWNQPFETIGGGDDAFTWTHSEIAEQLCQRVARRADRVSSGGRRGQAVSTGPSRPRPEAARRSTRHRLLHQLGSRAVVAVRPRALLRPRGRRRAGDDDPVLRADARREPSAPGRRRADHVVLRCPTRTGRRPAVVRGGRGGHGPGPGVAEAAALESGDRVVVGTGPGMGAR